MLSADFAGRGFIFSVHFQDIYGEEKELFERREYEARKLFKILNRQRKAELFIHYSNGYSKKIA